MKKFILLSIFISAFAFSSNAQVFNVEKTDCNITFINPTNLKVWYSYDLYQGVITYNPADDVKQFIISDNLRSNTFNKTQVLNFASIPILIDSFYSWKNQCIDLHK